MIHFIKVLLPKNSGLKEKSLEALQKAGFLGKGIKALEFRGEDIPFLVERFSFEGEPVFGITGRDLFQEYRMENQSRLSVIQCFEWQDQLFMFEKPCLCLLSKPGKKWREKNIVAVNRKYRRISENFLEKFRRDGIRIETIEVNGNTELAVSDGLADKCIEIVCSGKSFKKQGLEVEEKVFESDLVLIGETKKSNLFDLNALYSELKKREKSTVAESYTKKLFEDRELLARKLNEECFELVNAFFGSRRAKVVWEASDLLYFLTAMLVKKGVSFEEIWNELGRRNNEKRKS